MPKSLYKLHRIEGGYSVRHRDQDKDIQLFKGEKARERARVFKARLEEKAQEKEAADGN